MKTGPKTDKAVTSSAVKIEGKKIHYLTAGRGPVVVLLHGYTQTSRMWRPLIERLKEKFTVYAPDLPGIGDSDIPKSGADMKTAAIRIHALAKSLGIHQRYSGPLMDQLRAWLEAQLAEAKTEPNSGLGKAISYLLNHWEALTLFLRESGAPLDNNLCERALKKAILNRKNALFYKSKNGAMVGDPFMSLIHTCELNGANPFDYLTALQRHAGELKQTPSVWMPWNYGETLARLAAPAAA